MRTALRIFWEEFRGKYQGWFVLTVAIIAVGLWILLPFISQISPQLATGVSLSALVIILAMVLDHLIALRKGVTKYYPNQASAENETLELIGKGKTRLIEYSSRTISSALKNLRDVGAEIELLICNPNYTISCEEERSIHSSHPGKKDFQKDERVCVTIRELQYRILGDYDKVKIKCYRTPGSLRGRNFGDKWIQVGWYTYQMKGDPKVFGSTQIWGDSNPVITAPVSSLEGQILKRMVDEVFEKVWDESIPLIDVCGNCSKKGTCFGSDEAADEWLQTVSPKKENKA
ncbi:hypothetical protein ES703_42212 [subsurface metagenome]